MQKQVQRRLAAILAADVAGYSRLTGADEEGTLARLKALRHELIDPAIAAARGRIVKTTGDGILIEFPSAVDAVRCAIDVQRGMVQRNAGLVPEQRIEFRVGIHVGDVVVDGDDLLGDGVNVAARLEGIAEPGGISLSQDAWRQVEGKVPAHVVDRGEQSLKNIARPMRVYALAPGEHPATGGAAAGHAARRLSIVVLPFANLSGNPAEDYFADGITEDITTDLSRIPESFVIARNTAFTYQGKAVDAKAVGRELNVRYVLEGSVRRAGDRVRANVQLIDAETGAHLFGERFDCDRADLMDVQDEITARIANAVGAELTQAESRRSLKEHPSDPDAVDLAMRGWAALNRPPSPEVFAEARAAFEQALALDANGVSAMVGLAYGLARGVNSGFSGTVDADLARAGELVTRALTLAPDSARTHWVQGLLYRQPKRFEEAAAAFERAIALDRNFAPAYGSLGDLVTWLGRPAETIGLNEQAMRLSPRDPGLANWQFDIGVAHWYMDQHDQALTWLLRARATNPSLPLISGCLVGVYTALDRPDLARVELANLRRQAPWFASVAKVRAFMPTADPKMLAHDEEWYRALVAAGLPET